MGTVLESLREFLNAQSAPVQHLRLCPKCGNPLTYIDTTCWLYERDEAWTIHLPVCRNCESATDEAKITAKAIALVPPPLTLFHANAWRAAYTAALYESDQSKVTDRVLDAETEIALRVRELFQIPGDHIEEETDLDDAMYALHALRGMAQRNILMSVMNAGDADTKLAA